MEGGAWRLQGIPDPGDAGVTLEGAAEKIQAGKDKANPAMARRCLNKAFTVRSMGLIIQRGGLSYRALDKAIPHAIPFWGWKEYSLGFAGLPPHFPNRNPYQKVRKATQS